MSTLSERVRTILDEHPELDQPGLGRIAGVSKGTVNQWLDGKIKSMKLEYAVRIQKRLGYSALWLVLDEGEQKIPILGSSLNSTNTGQNTILSIESERARRATLLAESLMRATDEMLAVIMHLIDIDQGDSKARTLVLSDIRETLKFFPRTNPGLGKKEAE